MSCRERGGVEMGRFVHAVTQGKAGAIAPSGLRPSVGKYRYPTRYAADLRWGGEGGEVTARILE